MRIPVLLLIPSFLYDIEIIFLLSSFLFIHLAIGLKMIIRDYLHNKVSKIFLLVMIRLSSLELLKYSLELLI